MDLLNTEHINPSDVDIEAMESQLFNHPDPYDLGETDRIDPELQEKTIVRSSVCFEIADYIKLDDSKLKVLITNVDTSEWHG